MLGSSDQALAACAPSVPGAGATVTCTGADNTGISGSAANVTVNTDNTTTITTAGTSAIDLGTGAAVNVASGANVSSNASTITIDGGVVTTFATSVISSSTGPAVQFTGAAGTAMTLTVSGTVSGGAGIAADLGDSSSILSLTPTHNFVGNVVAGTGVTDVLRLSSSSNGAFNVSDIGTKYLGFDLFQKNGTSIWTLTGTGSQAWNVSNGSLVGTIDNLNANITNNANITFGSGTGTYGSVMSGTGSLTKTGTGTLTLSNANTYIGATSVTGGGLVVNGSITSTATVSAGARLGGTGTLSGIVNNGTLVPGNSIGTINVNGPVTFNPGSTYEVEIDGTGSSDRTIATGAVTINGGTVDVRGAPGVYNPVTNYTIVQGASRAGTFTGVIDDMAFLDSSLSYTATSAILTMTRNSSDFSSLAQDPVQAGVAGAVQQLGAGSSLHDAFLTLNSAQASQALETLSGEHNAGTTSAAASSAGQVQTIVAGRIQNLLRQSSDGSRAALHMNGNDDGGAADLEKQAFSMLEPSAGGLLQNAGGQKGFWSEVFGLFGASDSGGTAPGQNRDSAGVIVGADMALSGSTQFGVFGGWENGEIYTDTQFANSDIASWHGGLYANYAASDRLRLSGSVSGIYQDIDTTRHIQFAGFSETAKGETSGYSASAFVEAGYLFPLDDIALEPYVNLNITHSAIDGYRETDGGAANLAVDDAETTIPGHTIGVRAGKNIQLDKTDIDLHARLGWEHRYGDLSNSSSMRFQGGTSVFHVSGTSLSRNSVTFGAGADVGLDNSTSAYIGYDGSFAQDERNHGVSAGVKVSF